MELRGIIETVRLVGVDLPRLVLHPVHGHSIKFLLLSANTLVGFLNSNVAGLYFFRFGGLEPISDFVKSESPLHHEK